MLTPGERGQPGFILERGLLSGGPADRLRSEAAKLDFNETSPIGTAPLIALAVVLTGLHLTSLYSYVLFHTLAEVARVVVIFGVFAIAWHTRRWSQNNYLISIGISCLFVGILELLHALAYKGMGVFEGDDPNLPTQLWIAFRYLESVSVLVAVLLIDRRLYPGPVVAGYSLVTVALVAAIFLGEFPDCFIEGKGLTPFKIASEYIIAAIFLGDIALLLSKRWAFDREILQLLVASLAISAAAEVAFTQYVNVYGFANEFGHHLLVISTYFLYRAVMVTGIAKPFSMMFRDLKQKEDELEAKVAERTQALQESEESLRRAWRYARSLIETSLDPLVTISPEGRITDVNEATVTVTGVPRERLVDSDFCSYFTDPERARAGYRQAFAKGFVRDYPLAIRHASGTIADVLYNASVYRNEHGNVIGVFAAARDVSELKRTEEARNRLATIVETSTDAITGCDLDGFVIAWNHGAEALYGYRAAEVLGRPATILAPAERTQEIAVLLEKARHGEGVAEFETVRVAKDGTRIDVSLTLSSVRNALGEVIGISAIGRDIRARKRSDHELANYRDHLQELVAARTAELTKANAMLRAANEEMESFSYSVSHDLRAPLRAIIGFSNILVEDHGDKLDSEGRRVLNVVCDSASRMDELIDGILAFSRIRQEAMAKANIDMDALVRSVLDDFSPAIAGRRLKVELGALPQAWGDAGMIRRVWSNLLHNAIKFSAPKENAKVEVGGRLNGKQSVYFVRDNGVGFDMQHAHKLFGVFERLHGAEEFPGTGVGLSIVKRIVDRHGGRAWAEGKEGEGATFYFSLPLGPG